MDELCFYNRILSPAEIASTWRKGGDVTDPSLFIYYDFDEGPGAPVFVNKGVAGPVANLINGKGFNHSSWIQDAITGEEVTVTELWPVRSSPFRRAVNLAHSWMLR